MPRKYHRPPDTTSKRRKTRRSSIPYEFETPPVEEPIAEDETSESGDGAIATSPEPARLGTSGSEASKAERHITGDYGYVLGDVLRIAAIMAFLVIALTITSILR